MSKKILFLYIFLNQFLYCAEISLVQEDKVDAEQHANSVALSLVTISKSPRPRLRINRLPALPPAPAASADDVVDLAKEALEMGLRPNSPALVRSYESDLESDDELSRNSRRQQTLRSAASNSDTQNIPGMADEADVKLDENTIVSRANASIDDRREQVRSLGEPREIVASNSLSEFATGSIEITPATVSDITDEESINGINTERASPSDRKPQTWAIINQNNQDRMQLNSSRRSKIFLGMSLLVSAAVIGLIVWYKTKENKEKDKESADNPNNPDNKNNLVIAHE